MHSSPNAAHYNSLSIALHLEVLLPACMCNVLYKNRCFSSPFFAELACSCSLLQTRPLGVWELFSSLSHRNHCSCELCTQVCQYTCRCTATDNLYIQYMNDLQNNVCIQCIAFMISIYMYNLLPYSHENASGYYRVSAFFISKVLTDLIALRFLPNTVFALITYFMIG